MASELAKKVIQDPVAGELGMADFGKKFQDLERSMSTASGLIESRAEAIKSSAEDSKKLFLNFLFVGIGVSILLLNLVGWIVAKSIPRSFMLLIDRLAIGAGQIESASGHIASSSESSPAAPPSKPPHLKKLAPRWKKLRA